MTPFPKRRFYGLILGIIFCLSVSYLFAQTEDKPTLEEIAGTEAAKLYVSSQYPQALTEFQKLEVQYPRSLLIKRYIASLHDLLGHRDEAVQKIKEALQLKPEDLISRRMLADFYLKQTNLEEAEKAFEWVSGKDPQGRSGKYAKKRLEEIGRLKTSHKTEKGKEMSVEDFMKSEPAQAFSKGDYQSALQGFDTLLQTYPRDVLIQRFRGLTLLRLGRSKDSLQAFQEALGMEPENVALHYYHGEAYLAEEKMEEARKEFQWVIAHDEATYRSRAQQAIFRTLGRLPGAPRPWTLSFSQAYEYDTNATFKTNDNIISEPGDQNTGRYVSTFTGTDRFYQKGNLSLSGDGVYSQTLNNDFVRLNTYTMGTGVSALYGFKAFQKPAFLSVRDGTLLTFLKNKYYTWSNSLSTSVTTIPHKRFRATALYRWTVNEFDSGGASPDLTGRDGFASVASLLNTIYFTDEMNLSFSLGYDYERNDTLGVNYIKNSHGTRTILHFPLLEKVEGDVNFRFKDSYYPQYSSTPPKRDDAQFTLTLSVSRPLGKYMNLMGNYVFDYTSSKNNLYQYEKHVFGVQLTFTY